jgi:hypothetical protein
MGRTVGGLEEDAIGCFATSAALRLLLLLLLRVRLRLLLLLLLSLRTSGLLCLVVLWMAVGRVLMMLGIACQGAQAGQAGGVGLGSGAESLLRVGVL